MLGGGEGQKGVLRPDFDRSISVDFRGAKIASDCGADREMSVYNSLIFPRA